MLVNVPNRITAKDIHYLGCINKGGHGYYLSDIYNTKNKLELKCMSSYHDVYDVLDTYLFVVGQYKHTNKHYEDINFKQQDFINNILNFEYYNRYSNTHNNINSHNKKLAVLKKDIPSNKFLFVSKHRWLTGSILRDIEKEIDYDINTSKGYLKGIQRPQKRRFECLCDNWHGVGMFKHGFVKKMLLDKYICIQKNAEIDGFIIKYEHSGFSC